MTKLLSCRYNMDTNRSGSAGGTGLAVVQQALGICTDGAESGNGALFIAGV